MDVKSKKSVKRRNVQEVVVKKKEVKAYGRKQRKVKVIKLFVLNFEICHTIFIYPMSIILLSYIFL